MEKNAEVDFCKVTCHGVGAVHLGPDGGEDLLDLGRWTEAAGLLDEGDQLAEDLCELLTWREWKGWKAFFAG